ncbi:hypothetical protein [Aquitalea sp. LB_tupeE]|uniref:hypothetical protein n=1 Tax=Aquitalea sp. LB_tupeE TaxID=2748078 RepID=UPI0015BF9644|nr:hypothetical protein [Aquitalea sp. LB_tupeE]NWK78780.1 hypothetical protein [Aquitalea sp. LB_tupeE]
MRNDLRPLQQFRYPVLPRWWWLLGLFLLCLAINLGWGLLYYAKTADKSVSSLTFWTHALGYGLAVACVLLASILAGFSVMTLRVARQNRKLAAQHTWQQRRMQEGAAVLHSVLLGPACLNEADRQQLVEDAPTRAAPIEAFGEWHIPDLSGSDSDNASRAVQLAGALASRLAASWPVSAQPQTVAWRGSPASWQAFQAALQKEGIRCPQRVKSLADIEDLDVWIDQLHDEAAPLKQVMLAGLNIPTGTPATGQAAMPCEAGFALLLQASVPASAMLHRPVEIEGSADLRRAQHNAALDRAPGFIQLQPQHVACAAEAEWVATPLKLPDYWGDVGPLAPWVLLLSALDRAQLSGQPVGWHVQQAAQTWAGLVLPPTNLEQGEQS